MAPPKSEEFRRLVGRGCGAATHIKIPPPRSPSGPLGGLAAPFFTWGAAWRTRFWGNPLMVKKIFLRIFRNDLRGKSGKFLRPPRLPDAGSTPSGVRTPPPECEM
eukprot:1067037-Prorocentrum_minimum.AAC.2